MLCAFVMLFKYVFYGFIIEKNNRLLSIIINQNKKVNVRVNWYCDQDGKSNALDLNVLGLNALVFNTLEF